MDKQKKIDIISQKIKYAQETESYLSNDLSILSQAVNAVSKLTVGKRPLKREENSLQQILDQYSAFFEDDNEQGENQTQEPKNPADSVSLLGRLVLVKNYLTEEKSATSNSITKLRENREDLRRDLFKQYVASQGESSKLGTIEKGESSRPSRPEQDISALPESLEPPVKRVRFSLPSDEKGKGKGPAPDSGQGESPSFDDLYNPFDDIGID